MPSKKVKAAGLITAGCSVLLLMYYRNKELQAGSKAKAWVYDRFITDGSIDKAKMLDWLVASKLAATADEALAAIREVIENITPTPKPPT